jgi:hypothetical protein
LTNLTEFEKTLLTKKKFSQKVESLVFWDKISYMDAILLVCDENEIDPTDATKYVSNIIRAKLEAEAVRAKIIKGDTNQLPLD